MDVKTNLWDEFIQLLIKNLAWIGWILLGLAGKFSWDLMRNRKFTWSYVIGQTGIAIFIGKVGSEYILKHYSDDASILIPMVTLLSNNIISAIMTIDWKAIIKKDWKGAFDILTKDKK